MVIRPLAYQDQDKVLKLLRQRGTFNQKEVRVAMEVIESALCVPEKRDYLIFCACRDSGDLMGYICFGPIPMTDSAYDLYWIVVDERFSRRGVGRKLLEFMEDFLKKEGARRVYVETSSTAAYGPARSFYEKHRYRLSCMLPDFYREGDHKMIFMKELRDIVSLGVEATLAAGGTH